MRAFAGGHRQTRVQGDAKQLGGVFVISPGPELRYSYRSRFAGDHPDIAEVIAALPSAG